MTAELLRVTVGLCLLAITGIGLVRSRYPVLRVATAVVGLLWMLIGIAAVDLLAGAVGWWTYPGDGPRLGASPVDVLLPWAAAWGALPLAVADTPRPLPTLAAFAAVDVAVVPQLHSVVELGPGWFFGELLLLGAVAWPGLVLIQLMRTRRRLTVRTAMLVALFTAFAIGLIPAAAAELTGVPLRPPPAGAATMWVQVVALAAIPGLAAVVELHRAGGTPYPWDPPRRVTWAGPYAYVRNPMQLSMTAILLVVAAALRHWPTAVAGLTSAAVAAGMASGHERSQLTRRWGDEWRRYAEAHRSWLPTWRPRIDHPSEGAGDIAVLHLDGRCATCRSIGGWLTRRDPIGLTVADANDDGRIRWRATYRRGADERSGVAAVAAALTHVHLGWAVVGWTIGLPVLSHLAQLVTDVVIVEPHPVGGTDPANR